MPPRKVIEMPEKQFVGALEQQVERLLERVVATLRMGEASRGTRDLADEAERLLAAARTGRAGTRARPRRRHSRRP